MEMVKYLIEVQKDGKKIWLGSEYDFSQENPNSKIIEIGKSYFFNKSEFMIIGVEQRNMEVTDKPKHLIYQVE